jgi:excinuclease ABC subunit A
VRSRLRFLSDVGLTYLSLDRSGPTLSGGEAQRIRLASQVGSELTGVLYVLDEPSVGLHARDTARLVRTLERLRDLGNTVLVVEHDADTIRAADHLVDFGPGAGVRGGEVMAEGTPAEVAASDRSLTGAYLSGRERIAVPERRRKGKGDLTLAGPSLHNLKGADVSFPLGTLVAVTGVSGAGKSSLINGTLEPLLAEKLMGAKARAGPNRGLEGLERIDKVVAIDQKPIGLTPRSNPATYVKAFDEIRTLFAKLPEARAFGFAPGRFSFNVKGGRCEVCQGEGVARVEMHFLPDVYVTCDVCQGKRFNDATLRVRFKGKSIADVLALTIDEAIAMFSADPRVLKPLQTLADVGLGYLQLGQPSTTLSGGEAQRVKLSRELARSDTGATFYVLDEPTTGLHFEDVRRLLRVLDRLVEAGNTVLVIEHNLEVVKCADWVIDLGPEGGDQGGHIVAAGTPEDVARIDASHTGRALRALLGGAP